MPQETLSTAVARIAGGYDAPGVAAGVLTGDRAEFASSGVTSLADPLPVDETTVFSVASVTKTFTATALVRLAAEGRVDLDAPVRRYVPEFTLADEPAADAITVLNLLNHTGGLPWGVLDPEPSLAASVARLRGLALVAPPGTRVSYSQAGYNLAGRVVENVTGQPYETAVAELVLTPVGLPDTVFGLDDVVVRRFALGYHRADDGSLEPARPWTPWPAGTHGDAPGGGLASTARDLVRWARFHLGTGDGVLPAAWLRRMTRPTVGGAEPVGIGWFLRDVAGVRTARHVGSGNGQFAELLLAPDRAFAVVCLASGPDGQRCIRDVRRWALDHHLGVVERDPEPRPYDAARAREVVGRYEIDAMTIDATTDGARLTLAIAIRAAVRAASDTGLPPDPDPAAIGFLGDGDEYVVLDGAMAGERGRVARGAGGAVVGIDVGGQLFPRAAP